MKHDSECWCRCHCAVCGREATTMDSRGARVVMLCAEHAKEDAEQRAEKKKR